MIRSILRSANGASLHRSSLLPAALLLLASAPAYSDAPPLTYERVHLSTTANEAVENDSVVAVLYAQAQGHDLARASDQVNRLVAVALKTAKERRPIKAQTLEYRTTPLYQGGKPTGQWQVVQAIRLESGDSAALSALLGELQQTLALRSLGYELSDEARRRVAERLTQRAIEAFKARAQQVTAAWGRSRYRLVEMQIADSGAAPPQPLFQAAEVGLARAAPSMRRASGR